MVGNPLSAPIAVDYNAYGTSFSITGTTTNPYQYTGQQFDSLTGLYQLRARYYSPTDGRFLSRDIAGVALTDPVELDRYSYARNSPISYTDPSGQSAADELSVSLRTTAGVLVGGAGRLVGITISKRLMILLSTLAYFGTRAIVDTVAKVDVDIDTKTNKQCDTAKCNLWKAALPKYTEKDIATRNSLPYQYQIYAIGSDVEYDITPVHTFETRADGIDCDSCSILEAKWTGPGNSAWLGAQNKDADDARAHAVDQLTRYKMVIQLKAPVVRVKYITNTEGAAKYFRGLLSTFQVPGECQVKQWP
ncbi:MAG: RHS repeat-associated core domain-containing protein [Chloroflexia bacterium]